MNEEELTKIQSNMNELFQKDRQKKLRSLGNKMSKLSTLSTEMFFPPPWDINENPEKTEGWIEFQRAMKRDPDYYSL